MDYRLIFAVAVCYVAHNMFSAQAVKINMDHASNNDTSFRLFQPDAQHSKLNYNLGDRFNMPSYSGHFKWAKTNVGIMSDTYRISKESNGILSYYFKKYDDYDNSQLVLDGARYPNVTQLIRAIREYGKEVAEQTLPRISHVDAVKRKDTLLVHVRSGDFGNIEHIYADEVLSVSRQFQHTIIMSGAHKDPRFGEMNLTATIISREMKKLHATLEQHNVTVSIHYGTNPDDDAYLMYVAANLLVHRGGFSVLGAIVCQGDVYISRELDYFKFTDELKALIKHPLYL